ncbi:MAG: hypothetical protein RIC18_02215 [Hoeflea sp.]|uniref:hypothetical protein n=1 Tax=Hoeflea sp. TaxID=1940281 RepID=UPI0032EB34CE
MSSDTFQLPDSAPERIRDFHALWLAKASGDVPDALDFDVGVLSAQYPLLARIGTAGAGSELVWRDVAEADHWPFGTPVKGRPVAESVPPLMSVTRAINSFEETLASGVPDYFETTSWLYGGRTSLMARLVAPLAVGDGRELIALWEVIDPTKAG